MDIYATPSASEIWRGEPWNLLHLGMLLMLMGLWLMLKSLKMRRQRQARETQTYPESWLEAHFKKLWADQNGPELVQEYKAVQDRQWRFDFAHLASDTLIELHGGVHNGGRHVQGWGFTKDRRKMNAAQAMGYTVVELPTSDVTADRIGELIHQVKAQERQIKLERDCERTSRIWTARDYALPNDDDIPF